MVDRAGVFGSQRPCHRLTIPSAIPRVNRLQGPIPRSRQTPRSRPVVCKQLYLAGIAWYQTNPIVACQTSCMGSKLLTTGGRCSRLARFLHSPYGRSRHISPPLAVDAPEPQRFADPHAHEEASCLLPHLDRERPGRADTAAFSSRRVPTTGPPLKSERCAHFQSRKPSTLRTGRRWTISAAGAMLWAVKVCNSCRPVE
jgi:hypothetical protein